MEDNNVHTSVVIELANSKEESEEQNSYQIEIDDMNMPKDYVIDQIFCGENVTVYALFEVPENETRNLDKNYMKVNNSKKTDDNTFDYKKFMNEKKINGFKKNTSPKSSEEYLKFFTETKSKNKSLYCLKHPSGNYDLLTPERKKSDLRVLYAKNFALEESKSTKFKAISVGVNTDIVQCPRILEEVQKVLGVNVPLLKFREKMIDTSNYSPAPSSDVTELETRQSFTSLVSAADSKVSNLFFVPLLMMEDDNLSKFSRDSTQKSIEKDSRNLVLKVSLGINTDDSEFDSNAEMDTKRKQTPRIVLQENSKDISLCSSDQNFDEKLKLSEKRTILKEIKTMQTKLSALIEKIESSTFEFDDENCDLTESDSKICRITAGGDENKKKDQQNTLEQWEKNKKNFDERPILSTWNFLNEDHKPPINVTQTKRVEEKNETVVKAIDSVFNSDLSDEELHSPEMKKKVNERPETNKTTSYYKIRRKNSGSSKSDTNLFSSSKYDTLKNSLSLDFKNVKAEVYKNLKNNLFVSVENLKRKIQGKILQDDEIYAKNYEYLTDSGDECKKKFNVNIIHSIEEKKIEESVCEVKKNHKEEEGVEKPQTPYLDTNFIAKHGWLSPKRSLLSCRKESKSPDKSTEVEKKTCSDSEKPVTSNVNVRKIITTHSNMKKDFKATKKAISRYKAAEVTTKVDIPYKRILPYCRAPNKINGESKLHINKLIKLQGVNNNKISHFTKRNNDEKVAAAKGYRICRPPSQKLENGGNPPEVLNGSNKETENKCSKVFKTDTPAKKSFSSRTKVESVTGLENIEESPSPLPPQKQILLSPEASSNSSSVIVKLLSKKPECIKGFRSESIEEFPKPKNFHSEKNETPHNGTVENSRIGEEDDTNIENMEKSIVKSVWALTKVLLFEDGTKKLEVLEASLTPPGYSLNQPVKTPK